MTPDHADLTHRPEDGKRPPLEVGAWAVYETGAPGLTQYTAGMLAPPGMRLVRIVDGPTYRKDEREHAVDELWRCDDGEDRSRWCLTRVFVEETSAEALACAACVLQWKPIDHRKVDGLALRTMRLAELAKARPAPDGAGPLIALLEIIHAAAELEAAIAERHRFVHVSLPNLARNLYVVGFAGVAAEWGTRPPWPPDQQGDPHPRAAELADLTRRTR